MKGIIVGGTGEQERIALIDASGYSVRVFSVRPMAHIFTVRKEGKHGNCGPGEFTEVCDTVFNGRGELFVNDYSKGKIQVFDRDGKYLRTLECCSMGSNIALSSEGDLIVCDYGTSCMRMFGDDGNVVRTIELPAVLDEEDEEPCRRCAFSVCAGPTDNIVVVTESRMLLMSNTGEVLQTIIEDDDDNKSICFCRAKASVGCRGEIMLAGTRVPTEVFVMGPNSDHFRSLVKVPGFQVFCTQAVLKYSNARSGDPSYVCTDSQGRILYARRHSTCARLFECVEKV